MRLSLLVHLVPDARNRQARRKTVGRKLMRWTMVRRVIAGGEVESKDQYHGKLQ
jgi:hypothetical protein